MEWAHKWGDNLANGYYYHLLARGMIREADIEPEVQMFEMYISAFGELSSCRQSGMSLGPIPFTAILEYSKVYDVGDFDDFLYVIRRMDDTLIKLESKKKLGGKSGDNNSSSRNKNPS